MLATLPMYDFPIIQPANDEFWAKIAEYLDMPAVKLNRDLYYRSAWLRPDLLLSMTCGYPYRHQLYDQVTLVGTLDYDIENIAPNCPPAHYCSVIIARAGQPLPPEPLYAVNARDSRSGFQALKKFYGVADFAHITITGGHLNSTQQVIAGQADIASIDAVSFAHFKNFVPGIDSLQILGITPFTYGLPLITAPINQHLLPKLQSAIRHAIQTIPPHTRQTLKIKGFIPTTPTNYANF